MKKILVPCDFSEHAVNAFRTALDICAQSRGEVHLLNVMELPIMYDSVLMPALNFEEETINTMREGALKQFDKLRDKYAKDGQRVKSEVNFGTVAANIASYIEEKQIDVVVMGSQGASGMKEVFVGSNAEKVVRTSPVPVLVVKKYVKVESVKNIVFPNSLTQDQEDLVMKVKALQSFFKARLHVVYVNTPGNFTRDVVTNERLKAFAKRFMLKDYTLNIYNDPYEESGIINFTTSSEADLIAMGTHGRRGLGHMISGSVAENVVNHVDCPIWTYTIKS